MRDFTVISLNGTTKGIDEVQNWKIHYEALNRKLSRHVHIVQVVVIKLPTSHKEVIEL